MLKFTDEHEWLQLNGGIATIGITSHAAEQLGDLVFVELPKVGARLRKGQSAAVAESVKVASEVFAPAAGEVMEINTAVAADPTRLSADPQGHGWLYKLRLDDLSALDNLMDEAGYRAFAGLTGPALRPELAAGGAMDPRHASMT